MTPEEFLKYIKLRFEDVPFEDDAIKEIVLLARGVWRKIKKYLAMCIDALPEKEKITLGDVHAVITPDVLNRDLEVVLANVFPISREERSKAIEVLQFLVTTKSQQEILEELFGDEKYPKMKCSRMMTTLEKAKLVTSERDGKLKYWTKIINKT